MNFEFVPNLISSGNLRFSINPYKSKGPSRIEKCDLSFDYVVGIFRIKNDISADHNGAMTPFSS